MLPDQLPEIAVPLIGTIAAIVSAYLGSRSESSKRAAIKFETELRRILDDRLGLPSPATHEIPEDDLDAALVEAIPAYDGGDEPSEIDVVTSDGIWLAPPPGDLGLVRTLASAPQWLPYRPERFDCENFAAAFRTLAAFIAGTNTVGVVYDWSAGHAYNVIVDAEGSVQFYEPQSDEIVEIGDGDYRLDDALIVF